MGAIVALRQYQGACHCGYIRFEVQAEIDHVRVCDCSICHKRGALMFRVARDALRLLHPAWEGLNRYKWGSGTATDFFCPTCGILPFRHPSAPSLAERAAGLMPFDGFAVNVRCLTGVDPTGLPHRHINGRAIVMDQGEIPE